MGFNRKILGLVGVVFTLSIGLAYGLANCADPETCGCGSLS